MKKFWNWIHDDSGGRVLRLEGPIDEDDFWGDSVTPQAFRDDLMAEDGDITIWINSPGGSVWAAAQIYTMIRDYPGRVTVKIDAIAASAASVVAMAGDTVYMSPVSMLMIHDPSTIAMGNERDMEKAIETLKEVKESIINAYIAKTGLRHNKIAELMSNETWMNAKKAVELGFADDILYENSEPEPEDDGVTVEAKLFSARRTDRAVLNRLRMEAGPAKEEPQEKSRAEPGLPAIGMDGKTKDGAMPYEILRNQLDFLR